MIQKITEHYNNGEPVRWVKVHLLPDYVKFNHKRHVASGVDCQQCHGAVETMEVLSQHSSLSMGWCVNCHREEREKRSKLYSEDHPKTRLPATDRSNDLQ